MPIPILAGELDSGSFIIFQDGTPVCWMHSQKTNGTGTERWWWRPGFGCPANTGDQVVWTVQKDTYTAGQLSAWKNAYRTLAQTHMKHVVDIDNPN